MFSNICGESINLIGELIETSFGVWSLVIKDEYNCLSDNMQVNVGTIKKGTEWEKRNCRYTIAKPKNAL